MTTTVIITSPKPNHHRVGVVFEYVDKGGLITGRQAELVLDDGQSHVAHVYDGMRLVITEIKKEPAA